MKPFTACLLTQGQVAFYDLEDASKIERYEWNAAWHPKTKSYYATAGIKIDNKWTTIKMSRIIMGLDRGDKRQVDHINHDTLDNRKSNLRIVTSTQNEQNRRGVKGYYWNKRKEEWHARIRVNSKLVHLGYFVLESNARQAYLDARKVHGFIEYV